MVTEEIYAFARIDEHEVVIVMLNVGSKAADVDLDLTGLIPHGASPAWVWPQRTRETAPVVGGRCSVSVPSLDAQVLVYRSSNT